VTRTFLVDILALAGAAVVTATTHCTTYQEKTLGRLQTLCDDGTQAVSTCNKTLDRLGHQDHAEPPQSLHRADEPEDPAGGGALSVGGPSHGPMAVDLDRQGLRGSPNVP
jgi:hypothetical protein